MSSRQSPGWLSRSVMYQIFLRTFTAEGTLRAATARLKHLRELGVDIVYLCPITLQDDDPRTEHWSKRQRKFNNPRNPYRAKDYYAIDPEYGDEADLRAFVKEAHALNLRVLLDIVYLHCGPGAVFIESHPDFVKRGADGKFQCNHWNFPELNFESPALREYLHQNLEFWIQKFDIDGYRCDVSDQVPLAFWEEARQRLERLKRDVVILAEGQRAEDQLRAFDLNYCFSWTFGIHKIFNQGRSASIVRKIWEKMAGERPQGARFIRYIDNHDIAHDTAHGISRPSESTEESWRGLVDFFGIPEGGLPPDSRLDKAWGTQAVDALLVLCFTMDGVPLLYNGQEVADMARHSIYGRESVEWNRIRSDAGAQRFAFCQRLCQLRHEEKTLGTGELKWLDNATPDALLSYLRLGRGEEILVLINLSAKEVRFDCAGVLPKVTFATTFSRDVEFSGAVAVLQPYAFFVGKSSSRRA